MSAYYNEIDKFAAQWLRELIKAGLIAPGDVDERSIEDVFPNDLKGYTQCHFFAGIGGWSYALRLAGWPDYKPVWTGSCPCQPFSAAGSRKGIADERHLWPAFFHLIESVAPERVFGEQVASKDGLAWFDTVLADLERAEYTVGAIDLCAASVGAPHIRQRLFFVADSEQHERRQECADTRGSREGSQAQGVEQRPMHSSLVNSAREQMGVPGCAWESRGAGELGDSDDSGSQGRIVEGNSADQLSSRSPSLVNGFWRESDWLPCQDEKYRPVESGTFPLAHGVPNRVGKLRGYGNAIVPQVAEVFIRSYLEVTSQGEPI